MRLGTRVSIGLALALATMAPACLYFVPGELAPKLRTALVDYSGEPFEMELRYDPSDRCSSWEVA